MRAASSAVQQAAAVRTHSDLQVGEYTDWKDVSAWTEQRWGQDISENQVLFLFKDKVSVKRGTFSFFFTLRHFHGLQVFE